MLADNLRKDSGMFMGRVKATRGEGGHVACYEASEVGCKEV